MGFVLMVGPCFCCKRTFSYNPVHVPSYSATGNPADREPVCESCMEYVNTKREEMGLPIHPIHPEMGKV